MQESEQKMQTKIIELSQAIKSKIAKFEKLQFNTSSHHDAKFDRALYADNTKNFVVEDVKFYAHNVERVDVLTLTRADVDARLKDVALYDRVAFERAFEFESTYVLCCNSKAVSLNLAHHERKYSTLYRHLALYSSRADLYVMCAMSKKQREDVFNSTHFMRAVDAQIKTLTLTQIKNATLADNFVKTYKTAVAKLQNLYIAKLSNTKNTNAKTAKLIKTKNKNAVVAVN